MSLDIASEVWTSHMKLSLATSSKDSGVFPSDTAVCFQPHQSLPLLAVGTKSGKVLLAVNWQDCQFGKTIDLGSQDLRSVQKLFWSDNLLVSLQVSNIRLWTIPLSDPSDEFTFNDECISARTLIIQSRGVFISCALSLYKSFVAGGDTRGSVALYSLLDNVNGEDGVIDSCSKLNGVHGKEHVNDIKWFSEHKSCTAGNDGSICTLMIKDNNQLVKLHTIKSPLYTAITDIWVRNDCTHISDIIVGGYFGHHYIVSSFASGMQFLKVDTGSRQRSTDRFVSLQATGAMLLGLAVVSAIDSFDGNVRIILKRLGSLIPRECATLGLQLHNETVFDAWWLTVSRKHEITALLTGSEDCSARITIFVKSLTATTFQLPSQESGVRAVCSSQQQSSDASCLLVVCGGQMRCQFYLLHIPSDSVPCSPSDLYVQEIGSITIQKERIIDQRINAVSSVALCNKCFKKNDDEVDDLHLIVTADSGGRCFAFIVNETIHSISEPTEILHGNRRILSVKVVNLGTFGILVLAGTTGGVVTYLRLSHEMHNGAIKVNCSGSVKCHLMGTNVINVKVIEESNNLMNLAVYSGGDDQSLNVFRLHLKINGSGVIVFEVVNVAHQNEASLSAIRGLATRNDGFIISGYDQQLSHWTVDPLGRLKRSTSVAVDIGDINGLAWCDSSDTVAVCGSGVEIFQVKRKL